MGALGALLGLGIGTAAAFGISYVGIPMPPPPNSNMPFIARIDAVPSVLIGAFLIGFVATVFASLAPALRVARLPVVEALRRMV